MVRGPCDIDALLRPELAPPSGFRLRGPERFGKRGRQVTSENGLPRDRGVSRYEGEGRAGLGHFEREGLPEVSPLGVTQAVEHHEQDAIGITVAPATGEKVGDAVYRRRPLGRARQERS